MISSGSYPGLYYNTENVDATGSGETNLDCTADRACVCTCPTPPAAPHGSNFPSFLSFI